MIQTIFSFSISTLRVNFGKSETRIDQNGKVFCRITSIFGAVKPPRSGPSETALRLRSLPEGCPPQAKIFLYLIRIHRSSYWKLSLFCDFRPCILDQISITIMKILNLKTYFQNICRGPGEWVIKNDQ